MKREALMRMSESQIDAYARGIGIDTTSAKTKKGKAEVIESARARVADLSLLGVDVCVPIKRLHDLKVKDRIESAKTNRQCRALLRDLVGDEAWAKLVDAATEEDGTVDHDALVFAYFSLIGDAGLKNFSGSSRQRDQDESD